ALGRAVIAHLHLHLRAARLADCAPIRLGETGARRHRQQKQYPKASFKHGTPSSRRSALFDTDGRGARKAVGWEDLRGIVCRDGATRWGFLRRAPSPRVGLRTACPRANAAIL